MVERGGEAVDPAPEGFRNAGMNVGHVLRRVGETGAEAVLFRLKLGQPIGQGAMPTALLDDAHDLRNGLCRLGKLAAGSVGCIAALTVEPIGFLSVGPHGFGGHLRRHHAFAQASQHTGLQCLAAHSASIVAAIAEHMVGASVAILPAPGIGAFATAAEQQTGQQGARAVGGVEPAIPGEAALHALTRRLDLLPVECRQLVLPDLGGVP